MAVGLLLIAVVACASADWNLETTPLWADFGSNGVPGNPCLGNDCLLSDSQAEFIAKTYQIVSLEKCFGMKWGSGGNLTEYNFLYTSKQLKAVNPDIKILMYWNVPLVIGECYATASEFMNHTEWWLKDDTGKVIHVDPVQTHLFLDFTIPAAVDWWMSVPLSLVAQANADGVFFDGTSGQDYTGYGVSKARSDQVNAAAQAAITKYRQQAQAVKPDLKVIGNGLVMYPFPPDHGMSTLAFLDGVCIEHLGAFEGVDNNNGSVIPKLMRDWATLISQVVAQKKIVLAKAWIGPETTPIDGMGPFWPPAHRPTLNRTHAGIAQAAADNLLYVHSYFLCAVEPEVYLSYAWWYDVQQGYAPCPDVPNGCDVPNEFFPSLFKRVGNALSDAVWKGFQCQREFENVSVFVDLDDPSTARLRWKSQP